MSTHNICLCINKKTITVNLLKFCKCPKISNNLFHTFFSCLNFAKKKLRKLFLKIFSRKANSVDPDQTAPPVWSGSTVCLGIIEYHLR